MAPLPPIEYLQWAHARYGRAELDLATSGIPFADPSLLRPPALDDLGAVPALAGAIGQLFGVPSEEVCPALGTSQAIWLAYAAATEPDDVIAIEEPGYEPLVRVAEGLGRRVIRLQRTFEDGWRVDLDRVRQALADGARLVVLTDLHNPTGVALPAEDLRAVAAACEATGALVLVDEVYRAFDPHRTPASSRLVAPNVLAVASLTKVFGLGWARAGWLLAPAPIARAARRALLHVMGQHPPPCAALALEGLRNLPALRRRSDAHLGDKRAIVDGWIARRADVQWVPPARGLFGFPRLRGVDDARVLCERLHDERSLLLAPGNFFGAPSHVRLSWNASEDRLREGLEILGQVLDTR